MTLTIYKCTEHNSLALNKECEEESKINEYIDNLLVYTVDASDEINFDIRATGIVPVF